MINPLIGVREIAPDALDLTALMRPGDRVLWSQGTAEPLTLSERLVAQRSQLSGVEIFLGPTYSQTLAPAHADHLKFRSYCAIGSNLALAKAGVLDILPCHYSKIPGLIADSIIACDVVFLQLSAENAQGESSVGVAHDYALDAARRSRVVIAEINDQLPWTYCADAHAGIRIDHVIRTSRPVVEVPAPKSGDLEQSIARHAAHFIGDGAVLEMGIGAIPDAIIASLAARKDLGIHSGMLSDSAVGLIETGAVTNARKPFDRGITVAGLLFGSRRLYRWADRNPALRLCPSSHTHGAAILSQLDNLVAINSAIEVDLSGQVNAEMLGGDYYGAVGGQGDFVRGAGLARGGRSIVALPSTARNDSVSRVVAKLVDGVVTTPRSDADIIVTEWGAAELRGCTLSERARRMIAIAHPVHREQLEVAARKLSR